MELSVWVCIFVTLATLLYLYSKRSYSYWRNRNVVHMEPTFFFGNFKLVIFRKSSLIEILGKVYDKAKANGKKYCGLYAFFSPQFIPIDLELVKCILQKDFAHFPNHGLYVNEEADPLSGHLFNLEDERWRNMRAKLTPTFTSGKMKMMFQTMVDCTAGLQQLLKQSSGTSEPIDIKNALACFTTDVIGSVAFGLEINSMKNPDSDFRKYGNRIFQSTLKSKLTFIILNLLPKWLSKKLRIKIFEPDTEAFYINLVKNTVAYREQNNIYRKDFMHLLIQLKNLGKISDDDDGSLMSKGTNSEQGMTINEMAAQSFVFYIAGFETSATTMTFALLELAQRQDIQDKVREEINAILAKHDNKVTYDSVMEMEYLEKIVLETLRKHPPVGVIPRVCSKSYQVPNSDLVVNAGVRINIPVFSIHRDPEHYPEPEIFDPERFNEENKLKRHPFAFLPFGEGPRTCIGLRFGKLQSIVGLCCVLKSYKVTLNKKTSTPIVYEPGFISSVKGGVWLNLEVIS